MDIDHSAAPALSAIPKLDACWLEAPAERSPAFFPVFTRVSDAVQSALREQVPGRYFADLENFGNTKTAYPMLLYQASRPFHGKMRTDLTYDVLNPKTLARLFRTLKLTLPELLDSVDARLHAAGRSDFAAKYARRKAPNIVESVQHLSKSRKCLYMLIRAEAVLVNALVELGGLGGLTAKEQARRVASFEKKWSFQLRRLYPGTDFTWLAPVLLDAATQALLAFQSSQSSEPSGAGLTGAESLDPESSALQPHDRDLTELS
jgi:hypothetical protein